MAIMQTKPLKDPGRGGVAQLPTKPLNTGTGYVPPMTEQPAVLPVKPLGGGQVTGAVGAGMNAQRAEMLKRTAIEQGGPRQLGGGQTFGGYTAEQLQADPSLAAKLGAAGAAKYKQFQAQAPQVQPAVGQVKPAIRQLPVQGTATPPIVSPEQIPQVATME